MRALKILVVVMGVMLVVGLAALLAAMAARVAHRGPTPTAARTFSGQPIDIPPGARIEAMTAGPDRLVLALAMPEGDRQLLIIDLATGARVGTIQLRAAP
jgi:Family of unknown function (DUF6476)